MRDAEHAREFIWDITQSMQEQAHMREHGDRWAPSSSGDEPSLAQEYYGDAWKLLYGISQGRHLMESSRRVEHADSSGGFLSGGAEVEWSGVDHREWQEHYDTYGSGPYGRGLKIGKELATYTDKEFTFIEPEEDDEPEFTFIE